MDSVDWHYWNIILASGDLGMKRTAVNEYIEIYQFSTIWIPPPKTFPTSKGEWTTLLKIKDNLELVTKSWNIYLGNEEKNPDRLRTIIDEQMRCNSSIRKTSRTPKTSSAKKKKQKMKTSPNYIQDTKGAHAHSSVKRRLKFSNSSEVEKVGNETISEETKSLDNGKGVEGQFYLEAGEQEEAEQENGQEQEEYASFGTPRFHRLIQRDNVKEYSGWYIIDGTEEFMDCWKAGKKGYLEILCNTFDKQHHQVIKVTVSGVITSKQLECHIFSKREMKVLGDMAEGCVEIFTTANSTSEVPILYPKPEREEVQCSVH